MAVEADQIRVNNFVTESYFSRNSTKHGGTMIMRNAEVSCTRLQNLEQLSIEKHGEISGIYMNNLEIYVINVYRSPSGDLYKFLSTLEKVFGIINTLKNNIILTGDFNVKFDKEDPLKDCLLDFMRTYGLFT